MNSSEAKTLKEEYKSEGDAKVKDRLLIVRFSLEGKTSREIAEILYCTHGKVLYWKNRYVREGLAGLRTRPRSGKPRQLTITQEEKLKERVTQHDPKEGWTTKRVQQLIREETGTTYTQRHVTRILKRWGFSLVTPRPTFWQKASGEDIMAFWKKNPGSSTTAP